GYNFVEARIPAQVIPARIQEEIAIDRRSGRPWERRKLIELLERAIALAGPRVNERQIGNHIWTVERVLGNRQELDRALCFANRLFFPVKPGIKLRDFSVVGLVSG